MEHFRIITEQSPWLVTLCVIAGGLYAWALYSASDPFPKGYRAVLAAARFLVVFFLGLLLLEPFIKQIQNYYEQPKVVLAVDNSSSLPLAMDSSKLDNIRLQMDSIDKALKNQGIQTDLYTFDPGQDTLASPSKVAFSHQTTPLSDMLTQIRSDYENRNLQGVILLSDGIYNKGMAPDYLEYPFPVYSIGTGDTISRKDLNIKKLRHNKIAYRGNSFPIKAEIEHKGFAGENVVLQLKHQDKVLETKDIKLNTHSGVEALTFRTSSESTGPHHYTVQIKEKPGEFTYKNNTSHAYINILESKKKVLIAATAPHPDIKAIQHALHKKRNYEVTRYIPGIDHHKRQQAVLEKPYDLVIFHQIPGNRNLQDIHQKLKSNNKGLFYILGSGSDLPRFNASNNFLEIIPEKGQTDKVLPAINSGFDHFKLNIQDAGILNDLPPIEAPYGKYSVKGKTHTLFHQKVGDVVTDKPLLLVNESEGRKTAVLTGTGYWQWQIQEYGIRQNHNITHTVIQKLVQYLSTREDRRKFIVAPTRTRYFTSETVRFETEIYNDIYEPVYGNEVTLELSRKEDDEEQVYTYVQTEGRQYFTLNNLEPGVYEYTATTKLNDGIATSSGSFIVRDVQMESLDLQARHKLLRQLSRKTHGKFFQPHESRKLLEALNPSEMPQKIHSSEEMLAAIHLKWLFFLLLGLATLEWVMRKLRGVT